MVYFSKTQVFGAPWIDIEKLMEAIQSKNLPGILFKPYRYTPADNLYKGEKCNGLELMITDALKFRPVNTGIEIIKILFQSFPDKIKVRLYKTLANPSGTGHLDKLLGIENAFEKTGNNLLISVDVATTWPLTIKKSLLY